MNGKRRHLGSRLVGALTRAAALLTMLVLGALVGHILVRGIPNLRPGMFAPVYTSENQSMIPALVNTCTMTLLALLFCIPLGVGSAIYLAEYARRGSRLVRLVRVTAQTLQGIPSIVYGLFGMLFWGKALGLGISMLSGALTLSMMTLPLVMRTTEEALLAVPDAYREGSLGLGAGRLYTLARVVLPAAMPGVLSGVILAVGRTATETAALMYTSGTVEKIAGLRDSGSTLALHMYKQASEGLYIEQAYASGAVLLGLTLAINAGAGEIAKRMTKGKGRKHERSQDGRARHGSVLRGLSRAQGD